MNWLNLMLRTIRKWCCPDGITENSSDCLKPKESEQASTEFAVVATNSPQQRRLPFTCTLAFCTLLSVSIPACVVTQESRLEVGETFQDCIECPEMVVIAPGSYMMGSPQSEEAHNSTQEPQHRVEISYQFAVGKFEVTFREWDACVAAGGCSHNPTDLGHGRGNRPVVDVNWKDAKEYVDWLSRRTGQQYRLLSESEWEYVARAGTTGPFHFGSTISTDQANYDGHYTYGGGSLGTYAMKTVPVGSFPSNGFGLHDVHGNVFEWVEDCWHDNYDGAPVDGSAWISGGDCSQRVLRGGSYMNEPWALRGAFRVRMHDVAGPWARVADFGFRVARTLAP